ncbi:hypothetical protein [Actinoplanes sp. HUAS TT8]|uniref:hypothetical protein n=1 Tax=Actinoplanes sp. HUAS TT8 TaxID=3447453 RepID=UPI003F527063
MRSSVDGDPRLLAWRRVREFAVPPTMIETATARRLAGDWAGACAAARVDLECDLRAVGPEFAAAVRADLLHLAPDLLRWHFPRAEAGRLRPGLTVALASYDARLHLVARTAPAWADADQRITLALWDGETAGVHPHPRPHRRFRFDLHRHLWDVRRAAELRERSGAATWPGGTAEARHRWPAEAEILRQADEKPHEPVFVRINSGDYRELPAPSGAAERNRTRPRHALVLPDAATRVPPDLELLRAGLIEPGQLHPLVAEALAPGHSRPPDVGDSGPRIVECRGEQHRLALIDGVLSAPDHHPDELRREEILVAFGGTPLPCLQVIDDAMRRPESLDDIRARLDHGDLPGALRAVEALLGPHAALRDGPLRDALERAEQRHHTYQLYLAGLAGPGPTKPPRRRTKVTA